MTEILALIQARMGSSRFPGKPLAKLLGKPMIGHVYKRIAENTMLSLVAVATCDYEIAEYIESFGGRVVMTSDRHELQTGVPKLWEYWKKRKRNVSISL